MEQVYETMAREKASKMDAEYMAMRRRMSRLRVKCGKQSSLEGKIHLKMRSQECNCLLCFLK